MSVFLTEARKMTRGSTKIFDFYIPKQVEELVLSSPTSRATRPSPSPSRTPRAVLMT